MSHSIRTGWVNPSAPSGLSHAQKRLSSCACGEPMGATRLGFARARRQFVCAIFIWGLKALGFARVQPNSFAQVHCCVRRSWVRSCTVRIRLCGFGSRVHGSRVRRARRRGLDRADVRFGGAEFLVRVARGAAVGFVPLAGGWVRSCRGANSFVQISAADTAASANKALGFGRAGTMWGPELRTDAPVSNTGAGRWTGGIGEASVMRTIRLMGRTARVAHSRNIIQTGVAWLVYCQVVAAA